MYTPDGYMSAQLMRPNPGHFASGDWELLYQTSFHSSEECTLHFLCDIWSGQRIPPPAPRKCQAYQALSGRRVRPFPPWRGGVAMKSQKGGDLLRGYFFQNLRRIGHFLVFWFFLQKIP